MAKQELVYLAQKAAHAVAFDWHIQKEINSWLPEQEALYGLPPGSFNGSYSGWVKLVHPDDRHQFVKAIKDPQANGDLSIEFRSFGLTKHPLACG